jgi:hypothetical protein
MKRTILQLETLEARDVPSWIVPSFHAPVHVPPPPVHSAPNPHYTTHQTPVFTFENYFPPTQHFGYHPSPLDLLMSEMSHGTLSYFSPSHFGY